MDLMNILNGKDLNREIVLQVSVRNKKTGKVVKNIGTYTTEELEALIKEAYNTKVKSRVAWWFRPIFGFILNYIGEMITALVELVVEKVKK